MREILFRGKRLDNGEWVLGDLHHRGREVVITSYYTKTYATVDPATVGQFTGLLDKNDQRIFEGDILEGRDFDAEDGYGVVEWDDGAWEVISVGNWMGTFHDNYNGFELEIIGNIHDNPELLRGGQA